MRWALAFLSLDSTTDGSEDGPVRRERAFSPAERQTDCFGWLERRCLSLLKINSLLMGSRGWVEGESVGSDLVWLRYWPPDWCRWRL